MSWGGERYVLALRILAERRRSGNDFPTTQRQRLAVVNSFIETKGSFYLFWTNDLFQGCNCGAMVVTDYLGVICTNRSPL